eukprot:1976114-Pleurochrysis_carterae.AAC.1
MNTDVCQPFRMLEAQGPLQVPQPAFTSISTYTEAQRKANASGMCPRLLLDPLPNVCAIWEVIITQHLLQLATSTVVTWPCLRRGLLVPTAEVPVTQFAITEESTHRVFAVELKFQPLATPTATALPSQTHILKA